MNRIQNMNAEPITFNLILQYKMNFFLLYPSVRDIITFNKNIRTKTNGKNDV